MRVSMENIRQSYTNKASQKAQVILILNERSVHATEGVAFQFCPVEKRLRYFYHGMEDILPACCAESAFDCGWLSNAHCHVGVLAPILLLL